MFSPEKVAEARRAMKGEDADGNKLEADAWAAEDDDDDETAIEMAPKASRFSPSFQDPAETHLYKDPPSPTTPTSRCGHHTRAAAAYWRSRALGRAPPLQARPHRSPRPLPLPHHLPSDFAPRRLTSEQRRLTRFLLASPPSHVSY